MRSRSRSTARLLESRRRSPRRPRAPRHRRESGGLAGFARGRCEMRRRRHRASRARQACEDLSVRRKRQLQAWRGGATPFSRWLPTWKYFHRTGSCSVWVRALRQCRSKLYWPSVERVPPSSCSLLVARIAISVVRTFASATLTAVSATASSLGSSRISSIARPARSSSASAACSLTSRSPICAMVKTSS